MQSPVKIWRNQKKIAHLLGKTGTVVSWTLVRVPPGDFTNQAPYPVVLVEMDDKTRITSQLVDGDENMLTIGLRVITVIRQVMHPETDGIIPYGIKVKPLV